MSSDFVYYREVSESYRKALENALVSEGLNPEECIKGFNLEESREKPWALVDVNVKREFLWQMNEKLKIYKSIDYCLGRSWTRAKCSHCGGCPSKEHIRNIVLAKQTKPYTIQQFRERKELADTHEKPFSFLFNVGPRGAGVPRKMVAVALARALMLANDELALAYRGYSGSAWDQGDEPMTVTGLDRIDLMFDESVSSTLPTLLRDSNFMTHVNRELAEWGSLEGLVVEPWVPRSLTIRANQALPIDHFLLDQGLKFTLKKRSEGSYSYELVPKVIKKGIISALERQQDKNNFIYKLSLGPKFNWQKLDFYLKKSKGTVKAEAN